MLEMWKNLFIYYQSLSSVTSVVCTDGPCIAADPRSMHEIEALDSYYAHVHQCEAGLNASPTLNTVGSCLVGSYQAPGRVQDVVEVNPPRWNGLQSNFASNCAQ